MCVNLYTQLCAYVSKWETDNSLLWQQLRWEVVSQAGIMLSSEGGNEERDWKEGHEKRRNLPEPKRKREREGEMIGSFESCTSQRLTCRISGNLWICHPAYLLPSPGSPSERLESVWKEIENFLGQAQQAHHFHIKTGSSQILSTVEIAERTTTPGKSLIIHP